MPRMSTCAKDLKVLMSFRSIEKQAKKYSGSILDHFIFFGPPPPKKHAKLSNFRKNFDCPIR